MRLHRSVFVAGVLALTVWTGPALSAGPAPTARDSSFQRESVASRLGEAAAGFAYLVRPGQAPVRNLWLRRLHPEEWQTTQQERDAARTAFPLVWALVLGAAVVAGARGLRRARHRDAGRAIKDERALPLAASR